MNIKGKSGTEIEVEISGTQEEPKIVAKPFEIQGRKSGGEANIQHWKHKKAEEGLYFRAGDTYMQCASEMPRIRAAIAELPHKKYMAKKIQREINSDGYIINTSDWKFDRMPVTQKGTIVTESEMGDFLDEKGITEIEMPEAMLKWAMEKEEARLKVNIEGNKRAQAIFDDDESDQGTRQAIENLGLPSHLKDARFETDRKKVNRIMDNRRTLEKSMNFDEDD